MPQERTRQGRDLKKLEITACRNYYAEELDSRAAHEDLGVHRLLVNLHALREQTHQVALEHFANDVIAKHG